MRIQSHTKIIGLSLLSLFLFSTLAYADSTEDYRREAQEDVYARSNDALSPQDRARQRTGVVTDQDSSVLKDASDLTAATYESLRDSFAGLYNDASSTLGGWQSSLGDKWTDFVDSFSNKKDEAADKVDQAQEKARDSFHDTIADFEHYQKVFEKTGQKYNDQARSTLNGLLKDLQAKYGDWKNAATETYNEWTGQAKQSATDKAKDAVNDAVKDAKSKAREGYDLAKDKYFEAKARLDAELHAQGGLSKEEYVSALKTQRNVLKGKNVLPSTAAILQGASDTLKGASDTLKGASDTIYNSAAQAANYSSATYESLKDKLAALYGDASTTISAWQTTLGDKWDDFAGSLSLKPEDHEQSPAYDSYHNTINDFEYYQKVFVDETANDTYTQEAKDRINALISDLGDSYNNLKAAAQRRYDEWTGAVTSDDKSHALVAYQEAQSKYYQSKERLQHEFDFVTGKIDNATYQAKAAAQGKNILGRAADAVKDAYENVKGHFASGTEETLKRYDDAANTAAQKRDQIKAAVNEKLADAQQSATEAVDRAGEDYEELKRKIKEGAGEL